MRNLLLALLVGLALAGLKACRAAPSPAIAPSSRPTVSAAAQPEAATATVSHPASRLGPPATSGMLPVPPTLPAAPSATAMPQPPTRTPTGPSAPSSTAATSPTPSASVTSTRAPVPVSTETPAAPPSATPIPTPRPEPGGLVPGVARQIDALFATWDRPGSPGCSLGLGQEGRLVYARGYGLADVEQRTPITPDTIFNAGSIAKQVTAMAVELLREEGRLALDDDLRHYVPELPAYASGITLRQMLAHTSGLRDDRTLALMAGRRDDELLDQPYLLDLILRQQDTNFPPGQQFSYSNSNFSLLALIVQRVSSEPFAEFASQRLFVPLGMDHTSFATDPTDRAPGWSLAYGRAGNGYALALPNAALPGPTNLYTTVSDLVRWADNYSTARAGSRNGLAAVLMPARDNAGRKVAYNFGLEQHVYRDLGATLAHDGRDGGFRSELLFWPEQRRAVAVLCNLASVDAERLAEQAARAWLGLPPFTPTPQPAPRPTIPVESYLALSPAALAARIGVYYEPDQTHLLRLYVEGSRLRVAGLPDLALAALTPDRFRIISAGRPNPGEARFLTPGQELEIRNASSFNGSYRRYPDLAAGPDYSGTYYSPELDATYSISLKAGILTLDSRRFANIPLLPLPDANQDAGTAPIRRFEMAEALPPITVEFTSSSGTSGPITGFGLSLDRARHVRFERQLQAPQ